MPAPRASPTGRKQLQLQPRDPAPWAAAPGATPDRDRGVAPGSAQEPPYVGGGSWVRPARWVERGEAQEWPFEYSDKGGELVLQLPAMSSQDLDSGRWSLTFTWPLSPERS